jgi:hypothetical protein
MIILYSKKYIMYSNYYKKIIKNINKKIVEHNFA